MYLAAIILRMDPTLSSFMNSLKRQAANWKLGSLMAVGKDKVVVPIEAASTNAPVLPMAN